MLTQNEEIEMSALLSKKKKDAKTYKYIVISITPINLLILKPTLNYMDDAGLPKYLGLILIFSIIIFYAYKYYLNTKDVEKIEARLETLKLKSFGLI